MTANAKPKWPHGKRACISMTMDNMGEAADLNRGVWPADKPFGSHYSVTEKLPIMLDMLDRNCIKATYFIEAWNCNVYPGTIKQIRERGHEVGFHAYQHEVWSTLDPEAEVVSIEKSVKKAGDIGVNYLGFRPPGGLVTPQTLRLMRENGMTYLSPAAANLTMMEGIAIVPFQWESIDAYFYMTDTASLRKGKGDSENVLSPDVLKERLLKRIDRVVEESGYLALLFHPFLQTSEEKLKVMEDVLKHLASKRDEVWIAQCKDVADWIRQQPDSFGVDPGWDNATWKTK